MGSLKIGLVGIGGFGQVLLQYIARLQQENLLELAAVCDIQLEKNLPSVTKAPFGPLRTYTGYEDFLSAEHQLDAIIIATPIPLHVEMGIKAMEAAQAFRAKNNLVAPGAMQGVKLTDEQKVEMKKLFEQRLAIRKEALASYVASGQITQIQADNQIKRMQDNFNYKLENGFGPNKGGRGMGGGMGMGHGGKGGGPRF